MAVPVMLNWRCLALEPKEVLENEGAIWLSHQGKQRERIGVN